MNTLLHDLSPGRRAALRAALREAERARRAQRVPTITRDEGLLTADQLATIFALEAPLALPDESIFRQRLQDLISERGL